MKLRMRPLCEERPCVPTTTPLITLVSCAVNSLAISGEGFEDLVGGLGPHERSWVLVPGLDPVPDVGFEGLDVLVHPALEQLGGRLGEPALDLVEPGGAGRNEVHVKAGMRGEPVLDDVGLVGLDFSPG